MALFTIILLAIIQGITEFLPISSSGHLALFPHIAGESDQGQLIDIAAHVGTLFAVLLYFQRDVLGIAKDVLTYPKNGRTAHTDLFKLLIIASIPVIIAGFILNALDYQDSVRNPIVIGWTTLIFGIVLYIADAKNPTTKQVMDTGIKGSLFIGLSQILALVPGVSRSGITMTAARFLSIERQDAARFSMLLSIPAILGSAVLGIASQDSAIIPWHDIILVAALSFIAALIAIKFLMQWLAKATFTPFAVYRVILGIVLLVWAYS